MLAHKFSYKQGLPLYAHNFFYKFQALLVKGSSVYLRRFDEPLTFKKADSKFIDFVAKGIIVDQSNVELVLKQYMEKRSQPTYMHSIIKNIIMEEQKPLKSEYATISEYNLSNRNVGTLNTNITVNNEMMVKLDNKGVIKSSNTFLNKSLPEIVKEVLDYNIKGYDTKIIVEIGKVLDMNYRHTGFTLNEGKQLGSPDINISDYLHDKNIGLPLLGKGMVKGEGYNVSNAKEVIPPSITEYSNFNKNVIRPNSQIVLSNSVIPIKRPELGFINKDIYNRTLKRNTNILNEYSFTVHLENDSVLDIYKANTQQKYVSKTTTFDAFKEEYRALMPVYFIKDVLKTYNVKFVTHGTQTIDEISTSRNMDKGNGYGLRIGKHNGISVIKDKYDINKFINSVIGLDYQNYPNKIIEKNGRVIQAQHKRPIDNINIHNEHIYAEKISHRSSGLLPSLKFATDITNPIIDKRLHDDSIHYLDEIIFEFSKVIDPTKMVYNDTLRPIDSSIRESLTKSLDKTFTIFDKQGSFKYFDKTPYKYYKNGEYKFLDEPTIDIYLNTSYNGFNTPNAELFINDTVVNIKHRGQELDKDDSKYVKLTDDLITLVETQFLNNGNQVMEIVDKQALLNSTFKPKIQIQSGALLKENRKTDLRKHVTEKSNFYLFPTSVKKITKHETEKEEKWLDWTERWWFIQSTGEKIHLDIPDIDYPYETSKVMGEDKHPIQPFKGKGERNIAVSMEIVIEMVNITLHWWSHSFGSLVNGFGHEVMQAYFRVLEKWMNLDHSKEILKNLGSVEDYNRVIRWLRWEAEKVYFLSRQDEENKLLHHGNYYMEIFARNLLDFLEYHYYTILPLHGNLDRMDIMRNIMGVDSNPQGDIIDNHKIDKVLSAKDYVLNTDDNII